MSKGSKGPVWTIGYEGKTLDELIDHLHEHKIEQVADVRELPLSRKKGFSKRPLSEALQAQGIEYVHFKELGAPKEVRKPYLAGGSFEVFREGYLEHLATQQEALGRLAEAVRGRRTALLCFEADAARCHRRFIAQRLTRRGFRVHHV